LINAENRTVVILGVGRSGTSLIANWLQKCGLNIGQNLLESDLIWNPEGFFEDMDFHQLNFKIENQSKSLLSKLFFEIPKPIYKPEDFDKARSILQQKIKKNTQWGWKEPRTTWFWFDFWLPLLKKTLKSPQELVIIYVYRDFNSYLESVMRLAELNPQHLIQKYYIKLFKNKYAEKQLRFWIQLNQKHLDSINKVESDYYFIKIEDFTKNSNEIYQYLTNQAKLNLNYIVPNKVVKSGLLGRKSSINYKISESLKKEAQSVMEELVKLTK
jgi:hypothetical protein